MRHKFPTDSVTVLLERWRQHDANAMNDLMSIVYPELHRLASAYLRHEPRGHTLQPTALVHEAYLRLVRSDVDWQNRVHFVAVAARVMRRVLVDHARAKRAIKRGGRHLRVTWSESKVGGPDETIDVLELDESLSRLADQDERKSRVIELRFFGGLSYDECAQALEISVATVNRELRFAKAWLLTDMKGARRREEE